MKILNTPEKEESIGYIIFCRSCKDRYTQTMKQTKCRKCSHETEIAGPLWIGKLFEKGKAIRWVMIDTQHNVTGRIGAFINHKTSFSFKQPTGGIGFFECINNQQAADLLLNTAKKWLAKNGMEANE